MAITGLVHTSFTVADLDASVMFWTGPLGFELVDRRPWGSKELGQVVGVPGLLMDIAILKGHGYEVELIACPQDDSVSLDVSPQKSGASHMAFLCDDIAATQRELLAAGAKRQGEAACLTDDPDQPAWAVYLRDPNGIILELIESSGSM